MNKYISFAIVGILIVLAVWLVVRSNKGQSEEPITIVDTQNNTNPMKSATLKTNMGDITVEFFDTDAPNAVANFLKLAGEHFYDGVKFHRVIKGFMIQGGDPLSKDDSRSDLWGTGDPGYKFADEINPQSALYASGYKKGIFAMANSGPNTNGSQFFIMNEDYSLPPLYVIFGKVTSGQDVVDKIAVLPTGANDRPLEPVIMNSITLN